MAKKETSPSKQIKMRQSNNHVNYQPKPNNAIR